jgi:hypothetical protein
MSRSIRIALLLFVLATVAQWAWMERQRVTDWAHPLRVVVYPIDADRTAASNAYVAGLDRSALVEIEDFLAAEAGRHGLGLARPVEIALGPRVHALPPEVPAQAGVVRALAWSLRMRVWAWRHDDHPGPRPHVRLFVVHHDPARSPRLAHSTGLAKGMIGVVHVFAAQSQARANNVVIAHELLHTFGASDKYDPATNLPRFPDGYADPAATPRHPQRQAEIMAGRRPLSMVDAETPASLDETLIGDRTAAELHWRRAAAAARR